MVNFISIRIVFEDIQSLFVGFLDNHSILVHKL